MSKQKWIDLQWEDTKTAVSKWKATDKFGLNPQVIVANADAKMREMFLASEKLKAEVEKLTESEDMQISVEKEQVKRLEALLISCYMSRSVSQMHHLHKKDGVNECWLKGQEIVDRLKNET